MNADTTTPNKARSKAPFYFCALLGTAAWAAYVSFPALQRTVDKGAADLTERLLPSPDRLACERRRGERAASFETANACARYCARRHDVGSCLYASVVLNGPEGCRNPSNRFACEQECRGGSNIGRRA